MSCPTCIATFWAVGQWPGRRADWQALPQGEGTAHPALRRVEALRIVECAAYGSPSPRGEGRGEGEETLRKPARWRTADGVDYADRRKTKPHARRGAESLTVASRLPPHPCPPTQREPASSRSPTSQRAP